MFGHSLSLETISSFFFFFEVIINLTLSTTSVISNKFRSNENTLYFRRALLRNLERSKAANSGFSSDLKMEVMKTGALNI